MSRAMGLLGLAARARKIASGEDLSIRAIRGGAAAAVLLDADAGPNTAKAVTDACNFREIPLYVLPAGELGNAIGRRGRMVCAVLDGGLGKRIGELVKLDGIPGEKTPD